MRPAGHIALSSVVSLFLWAVFRSYALAFSNLLAGVLIDLDHLIDHFAHYGFRTSVREFFDACYERTYHRAYLVLHGWEWLGGVLFAAWASGWNPWLVGLLVGWTQHLVADQFSNRPSPWGYSLLYRIRHGWNFGKTFPPVET
jgi:hypothetical protein